MRYLTDGNVMGEYGWTYTLIKGADGWRMVSIYSHDPNKALICSSYVTGRVAAGIVFSKGPQVSHRTRTMRGEPVSILQRRWPKR
jgi:hypothetical protein